MRADKNRAYDSTIHCASTAVAPSRSCICGRATFVTVLSIKAIADPMMVAARIQGPDRGEQGASAFPERMTPTSQGGLPMFDTLLILSLAQNEEPSGFKTSTTSAVVRRPRISFLCGK